jgi:8-oxo-dGTP pyrophosphatase MutT (NUDIX family)
MKRASKGVMAGAWVFPGGKTDPVDLILAEEALKFDGIDPNAVLGESTHLHQATLRLCAVRETLEETGQSWPPHMPDYAPEAAAVVKPDHPQYLALKGAAAAPQALGVWALTFAHDIVHSDSLQRLVNFTTPLSESRRFSTAFFLQNCDYDLAGDAAWRAAAAEGVENSGGEVAGIQWASPSAALDAWADGTMALPPPQFLLLHTLKQLAPTRSKLLQLPGSTQLPGHADLQPHIAKLSTSSIGIHLPGDSDHPSAKQLGVLPGKRHRLVVTSRSGAPLPDGPLPAMADALYEWHSDWTASPTVALPEELRA